MAFVVETFETCADLTDWLFVAATSGDGESSSRGVTDRTERSSGRGLRPSCRPLPAATPGLYLTGRSSGIPRT